MPVKQKIRKTASPGQTERGRPTLMAIMLAFVLISMSVGTAESQTRTSIQTHHTTLWELIEGLIGLPSLTLDAVEQVLPVKFMEGQRRTSFSFYDGGPLRLVDQVVIKTATLAIEHKDGISSRIGFDIDPDGTCVTIDDVRVHHPEIEIFDTFYGEITYWAVQYPWGRLTFAEERNPACLSSVGIRHNEPLRTPTPEPK